MYYFIALVPKDHRDPADLQESKVNVEHLDLLVELEVLDLRDRVDKLDHQENLEPLDRYVEF